VYKGCTLVVEREPVYLYNSHFLHSNDTSAMNFSFYYVIRVKLSVNIYKLYISYKKSLPSFHMLSKTCQSA
jgi:hypothetical protein